MLLGIDVGGTYTDAVLVDGNRMVRTAKRPTDSNRLLDTVLAALDAVLQGESTATLTRVALSTTLVTNAIVEGRTEKVGLVLIPGPGLDWTGLVAGKPKAIAGYTDHRGQERATVDLGEVTAFCREEKKTSVFAVSAKFAVRNPDQENEVAASVAKVTGADHISRGAAVSGGLNFIRRTNSAYFNAAVWRQFGAFAEKMEAALLARGIEAPVCILKADGGTLPLSEARHRPVESIFTGPAASVLGIMALYTPSVHAVSVDIGGTTTDLALWRDGLPLFNERGESINGYRTSVRAFRLRSLGLGGDSYVRREDGRLLVGPERKGSAFCMGGPAPTVTDALVVLGHGAMGDREQALLAMREMAVDGQSPEELATVVVDIVCDTICSEIRAMVAQEANAPVYRVEDIIHQKPMVLEELVGVGGGAAALAPLIAERLGVRCRIPIYAEVANAVGAALAKSTIDITLRADTSRGEYIVPELGIRRKLEKKGLTLPEALELARMHLLERAANADIEVTEIQTLEQEEFNIVRGFSTAGKILTVRLQVKPGVLCSVTEGGAGQ